MGYRFNPPPGWPPIPDGWMPPDGWQPDPSWPAAPEGWSYWVPDTSAGAAQAGLSGSSAASAASVASIASAPVRTRSGSPAVHAPHPTASLPPGTHASDPADAGGLFGKRKRVEADNIALRQEIARLSGMDPHQIAEESAHAARQIAALTAQRAEAQAALDQVRAESAAVQQGLVQLREEQLLQEVGIYEYRHRLADAVAYKSRLERVREHIKVSARGGSAVLSATHWTVNNSATQGRKMVNEISKLMLRAYNAEADSLVRDLRAFKVAAAIARLSKTRDTIAKLGATMQIRISDSYHLLRVEELELTADYLAKAEEEKERIREERERQREEAKAQKEFEREKARLFKEQAHYRAAFDRLSGEGVEGGKGGDGDQAALAEKLAEIEAAIKGVEDREANIRAGYVYVISNVGSFGPDVVKIGLTRRLDPMDRVRELGDASVPFRFDVHALVFSDDAVSLETALHHEFAPSRLNRVNLRREFFRATPTEVRNALDRRLGHHLLEFTDNPEALEWRQSQNDQRSASSPAEIAYRENTQLK